MAAAGLQREAALAVHYSVYSISYCWQM
jgi:hypothetical protein